MSVAADLARRIADAGAVSVLTGAGMSAESGIPTFRGTHDSLWSTFDPMALATETAWRTDRDLVWGWYRWRMALVAQAPPNAGHRALAALAQHVDVRIATQNVDDLHERAGSVVDAHVHGSLFALRCFECGRAHEAPLDAMEPQAAPLRAAPPFCAYCDGDVRPGVVWFGEALPEDAWQRAVATTHCAVMLVVGTSGLVQPAASLPLLARRHGAYVVELNPARSALSDAVDLHWPVTAAEGLPLLQAALTT
ncbi:NAD-dependent deacetylase [Pseudoxanthomonas sp. GM95]|uniref:SIR2 family NAD-dependent protein deacylase n=1 Tax=Pseudoxanthomonas sp. GM95 TaxID=1881043 RepID=UPI0008B566AA|nr:NAD-dependent protein deacylase [Pseudoxanthomonas sp. GM95]SEM47674.1 NAD-dependent deacetylase [Pseudoxanthomonas sp. GM95]